MRDEILAGILRDQADVDDFRRLRGVDGAEDREAVACEAQAVGVIGLAERLALLFMERIVGWRGEGIVVAVEGAPGDVAPVFYYVDF